LNRMKLYITFFFLFVFVLSSQPIGRWTKLNNDDLSKRSGSGLFHADGFLYIVAGASNNFYVSDWRNETFAYNLKTQEVSILKIDTGMMYGKADFASVYLPESSQFLMIGGNRWRSITNEITSLNAKDHTIKDFGLYPGNYRQASAVLYKGDVYVFGGDMGGVWTNELWKLEVMNNEWTEIIPNDRPPSGRGGHVAKVYKDSMYVFGGGRYNDYDPNVYRYDISENYWENITTTGGPKFLLGACSVSIKNKWYIFGGFNNWDGNQNNLWEFDFDTRKWALVETIGGYKPNGAYACGMDVIEDKIYLFGGRQYVSGATATKDFHVFTFN